MSKKAFIRSAFKTVIAILITLLVITYALYNFIEIDTNSKIGCRSPEEPGCQSCVYQNEGGGCTTRYASDETDWYNGMRSGCREDAPECALCSKRSESILKQVFFRNRFTQCDCESIEIGIDPCFSGGCECICNKLNYLTEACPLETNSSKLYRAFSELL